MRIRLLAVPAVLAVAGGLVCSPAQAQSHPGGVSGDAATIGVSVNRIAGADRYATSAQISAQYASGVAAVYVATGAAFPDALAAAAAAGTTSPVLLVAGGNVPDVTRAEIVRLHPGRIIVVGGSSTIPDSVGDTLAAAAGTSWARVAGADRYATAAALAAQAFPAGANVAYVVSGTTFPDALTASALGANASDPVLLTSRDTLPGATAAELRALRPASIRVLGGASAVSDAVLAQLGEYAGDVSRISGPDRYATNVAADAGVTGPVSDLVVASGANFPDALSGAALAGHLHTAMLLVGPGGVSADQQALVARLAPTRLDVLGGTGSVDDATIDQLLGKPAPVAGSPTDYSVSVHNGSVVAWPACASIGWQLGVDGGPAPAQVLSTLTAELAKVSAATGLSFRYDGTTDFVPTSANLTSEPDDLIVALVPRAGSDLLTNSGELAGYGGWYASGKVGGAWTIKDSYVLIADEFWKVHPATTAGGQTLGVVALHEFGHAVGLNHATGKDEIMYPVVSSGTSANYGAGDLAGLAAVGGSCG